MLVYLMAEELIGGHLPGEIPEQDDVVHACGGDVLAGGMQIERHDGFLVSLEGANETGVFLVIHKFK